MIVFTVSAMLLFVLSLIYSHVEWVPINGDGRCEYLYRLELFRRGDFAIYLHHFVGDDWSLDRHDHPKNFISIGILGAYIEETDRGEKKFSAPWIRSFRAEHCHRLKLIDKRPCWTIAIVGTAIREWGWWTACRIKSRDWYDLGAPASPTYKPDGRGGWMVWVPWKQYVPSIRATERKSCP